MSKILMLSLDKKILDAGSFSAKRMVDYGRAQELFILIPSSERKEVELSNNVKVYATGGNKITQFFRLCQLGKKLIDKNKIEEVTTQDPFFTGSVGLWLKKLTGIRLEIQLHGDFFSSNYYRKSGWGNWIKFFLGKINLPKADVVRVAGQRIKESLLKISIAENKITVRPVKINEEQIKNYQTKFNLHQKYSGYEKLFLILGRVEPVKNIVWVINAFNEVVKQKPNYLLLIVGDGTGKNNLINQVKEKKLEKNIKFEGWTNDPFSYLKTADCLLFPSLSEGYGLVVMEAVAASTSIIMTDVGVANYELQPEPKVKIIPVGDQDKFIQAILQL